MTSQALETDFLEPNSTKFWSINFWFAHRIFSGRPYMISGQFVQARAEQRAGKGLGFMS